MKAKEDKGLLIQTWPKKVWAIKKMKCNCCRECLEDPRTPGRCIYGGPFRLEKNE